ncbi:MAG: hypothetical protein ACPGLV_18710 [Bacteroidia bacterium]
MTTNNQAFINDLIPILNSTKLLFGRDDDKGKVWVYCKEWEDTWVIEVIRVFHKHKRHFIFTTWGESKLPCLMSK